MPSFRVKVLYDYDAQQPDELSIRVGDIVEDVKAIESGWFSGSLRGQYGVFPDNFVEEIKVTKSNGGNDNVNPEYEGTKLTDRAILRRTDKWLCKALFDYEPEAPDELALIPGDIVEVLGEVEDGWWRGRLNDKEGVFPSNFVKEIRENEIQDVMTKPTEQKNGSDSTAASFDANKNPVRANRSPGRELEPNLHLSLKKQDSPPPPALPPKPVKEKCEVIYSYTGENDDELTLEIGDLVTILSKDLEDPGWWRGELRGKIGVFPDNFVMLLPPEPSVTDGGQVSKRKQAPPPPPPPVASSPSAEFESNRKSIATALNNLMTGSKPPTPSAVSPIKPMFPSAVAPKVDNEESADTNSGYDLEIEPAADRLKHLTVARPRGPANRRPPSALVSSPTSDDIPPFSPALPAPLSSSSSAESGTIVRLEPQSPRAPSANGSSPTSVSPPTSAASSVPTNAAAVGGGEDVLRRAKPTKPAPPPWLSELRGAQNNRNSRLFTGIMNNAGVGGDGGGEEMFLPPPTSSSGSDKGSVSSGPMSDASLSIPETVTTYVGTRDILPPGFAKNLKPMVPSKPSVMSSSEAGKEPEKEMRKNASLNSENVGVTMKKSHSRGTSSGEEIEMMDGATTASSSPDSSADFVLVKPPEASPSSDSDSKDELQGANQAQSLSKRVEALEAELVAERAKRRRLESDIAKLLVRVESLERAAAFSAPSTVI